MADAERSEESPIREAEASSPSVDRLRSRPLDRALVGSLPCIVCGYDLRGVSIRGMCPECGTAVRATILYRIDPEAEELQPMCCPQLAGVGIVLWATGGLAAIVGCWAILLNDAIRNGMGWSWSTGLGPEFVIVAAALSMLGLLGIIRPTRRSRWIGIVSALGAAIAYVPAAIAFWRIQAIDRTWVTPYSFGAEVTVERELWRGLLCLSLAAILLGIRPNARELVRRSLAMRTGRVDRQTIYAMVAAIAVSCAGDAMRLASRTLDGTAGVEKLANAVKATLGPRGRNAVIDKSWGGPTVTKDGVTVAEEIELRDKAENMGALLVKEAASKTSDDAGDGTTTSTVLAEALFREGLKYIAAGVDANALVRGMKKGVETAGKAIDELATPINGKADIQNVATISANNDPEIGKIMADAFEKVGKDGVITVEEGKSLETEVTSSRACSSTAATSRPTS
jgi:hypothetical protein